MKKKLIFLIILLSAGFLIYKITLLNNQVAVQPKNKELISSKISLIEKAPITTKNNQYKKPELKTDLEVIWYEANNTIPVASYLDELLSEVENDNAHAINHLAYIDRICSGIPRNEEELNSQIKHIKIENRIQNLVDNFILCEDYPREQFTISEIEKMIIKAARLGSPRAKLEFAAAAIDLLDSTKFITNAETIVDLKKEAMQHYYDAKNMGEQDALLMLAMSYKSGALVEKNLIESAAYYSAYKILNPDYSGKILENILLELSEEEINLINQKVEQYARCCL